MFYCSRKAFCIVWFFFLSLSSITFTHFSLMHLMVSLWPLYWSINKAENEKQTLNCSVPVLETLPHFTLYLFVYFIHVIISLYKPYTFPYYVEMNLSQQKCLMTQCIQCFNKSSLIAHTIFSFTFIQFFLVTT